MEVKKCTMEDLDELALWSMQAQVDMREGSYWGGMEESPELLAETREDMRRCLESVKCQVYEFLVEGTTVGHVVVRDDGEYPGVQLENFGIRREYRRRHYGTRALHALMEHLGADALDLDVFCWNKRAVSFYKSFGFREISLHMNYGT